MRTWLACLTLLFAATLLGDTVHAQATGVDARCFTKTQCENVRAGLGAEDLDGFYNKPDAQAACGGGKKLGQSGQMEEVGFCLPVGQSVTKISFGGRRSFANLGEFIQYIYRYGMWLAGIIAVAFIVVSGFQWAMSGGNSDTISSAKSRIGGAVTGLVLLALSYTILSNINPYLVQLRLPQAWLINAIGMAAPFCSDVKNSVAYLSPDGAQLTEEQKKAVLAAAESNGYPINPQNPTVSDDPQTSPLCGQRYIVAGTAGQSCLGELCPGSMTCVPINTPATVNTMASKTEVSLQANDLLKQSACWHGNLIIKYSIDNLFHNLLVQAGNNYAPGTIEQDENDHWFQDEGGLLSDGIDGTIYIFPVCKLTSPPESQKDSYSDMTSTGAKLIASTLKNNSFILDEGNYEKSYPYILTVNKPGNFREYLVRYQDLDGNMIEKLRAKCHIPAKSGNKSAYAELVGVVIQNQINAGWDDDDYLIYAYKGQDKKGAAWIWTHQEIDQGAFADFPDTDYLFPKGYIPIEDIDGSKGKGLYLDLQLSGDVLGALTTADDD